MSAKYFRLGYVPVQSNINHTLLSLKITLNMLNVLSISATNQSLVYLCVVHITVDKKDTRKQLLINNFIPRSFLVWICHNAMSINQIEVSQKVFKPYRTLGDLLKSIKNGYIRIRITTNLKIN